MDRRDFLKLGIGTAIATGATGCFDESGTEVRPAEPPPVPPVPTPPVTIPKRALGQTGEMVTMLGLGGQGLLEVPGRMGEAVAIIHRALDLGITYFDTATVYGPSQDYLGEGLAGRRDGIFLASKTVERTRDGSLRVLEDSLRRLRTDHLDLWQVHNVASMAEVEQIFGPGGAIEAIQQARADKRVRFVGVTGHWDPAVLLECVRRFDFDTILMALNITDRYRLPFAAELLPLAVQKKMGVIAMKVMARGALLQGGTISSAEALSYVWSHPTSVAIVGVDNPQHVETNVAHAGAFQPLAPEAMQALETRAAPLGSAGTYFRRPA